jgi:hypothetical protein
MLSDAVDAFLDAVGERPFDEPLLALLRSQGFTDVHLVHGAGEFGKDAIGKRDGVQWALQSKAGDISQGEFRRMSGQLDELRRNPLSHPSFEPRSIVAAYSCARGASRGTLPWRRSSTTSTFVSMANRG